MFQSPILISHAGNGPTTALDLRTIPEDVRVSVRDGEVVIVPIEGLTELELAATRSRIMFLAAVDVGHADELEAPRAAR